MNARFPITLLLLCAGLGGAVDPAAATGLYKGHGRISGQGDWSWRVNGSVGFHGVQDPWDQFGVNSFPVGGYTNFGVEFSTLSRQSFGVRGGYYWVNDDASLFVLDGPPAVPRPGSYAYEVDAWSAGAQWRVWASRGKFGSYLGLGAGWVFHSALEYRERVSGQDPYRVRATGNGPQVDISTGYEGMLDRHLRIGMEVGFRYSWVDFDNGIYDAGNFIGLYLGFRLGIVSPRPPQPR